MKEIGIVRDFDAVGRIVIPKEIRDRIFGENIKAEIFSTEEGVLIKPYSKQKPLQKIECHCVDCKYWSGDVAGATDRVKICTIGGYMVGANGYCVFGEKAQGDKG